MLAHTLYASSRRETESQIRVTYWHVPGGYDAVNARLIECYFDTLEQAERFCAEYKDMPEMACIG